MVPIPPQSGLTDHSESLTSVLRPGTLRRWCALSIQHSNRSSSAWNTVFQYTPRDFNPDQRHAGLSQPVRELCEPGERRLERLVLLIPAAATLARHADRRHDVVAMHVESRTPLYQRIHGAA